MLFFVTLKKIHAIRQEEAEGEKDGKNGKGPVPQPMDQKELPEAEKEQEAMGNE